MSDSKERLDSAFHSLQSRRSALSDSFSQALEDRLMVEQKRLFRRKTGRPVLLLLLVIGALLIAGGTASYAAVANGWTVWTFSIDDNGIVTDEAGELAGESYLNDDGTTTTVIHGEDDVEYRVDSDRPLDRLIVAPLQ